MTQKTRRAVLLLCPLLLFASGCTCFIPSTGFLTWRTNHEVIRSLDEASETRDHAVEGSVAHIKRWGRWPLSIANTGPCAVEYKVTIRIDSKDTGDPHRRSILLTLRDQHPLFANEKAFGKNGLQIDDPVRLAYNLGWRDSPTDILLEYD
ncbi:MAG: hypothetical protein ACPGYV_04455, partial [Phycisphaeraceae bacterium]